MTYYTADSLIVDLEKGKFKSDFFDIGMSLGCQQFVSRRLKEHEEEELNLIVNESEETKLVLKYAIQFYRSG